MQLAGNELQPKDQPVDDAVGLADVDFHLGVVYLVNDAVFLNIRDISRKVPHNATNEYLTLKRMI